ncbi:hypothetical protein CK203_083032 [Vitis vinifera]|uniref:Uncharacterized protein n=1 Tax=Vitis vinifera TaxID=29760 RepID=A0A438E529_VITVI|nr:hypothetical protein CK203_083032 [Vitis vinifera]
MSQYSFRPVRSKAAYQLMSQGWIPRLPSIAEKTRGFFIKQASYQVFRAKRLIRSRLWPTGSTGWGTGRPVSLVRSRSGRGRHKNLLSLPIASSSRSSLTLCPVEVRSRSGRSPVEATVTCYALNAPTASDPVDPLLVRSRLLSAVFVSRA